MHTYDCVVVGAGISGLSAAYELHQRGASVLVVEARAEAGGSMRSEQTAEGFLLENGPNTVVTRDPALDQQFAALGIASERLVANPQGGRRYIVLNGKPELLPMSPSALFKTPLLSTRARLRLLAEPFIPRATTPDESVAAFFTRRLGAELADNLVDPFVSGVYAGNPRELSVRSSIFAPLWEAERRGGNIVLGMLLRGRKKKGPRKRSEMITFRQGLVTWPRAIVQALGAERVWFNTSATALRPDAQGWHVTVTRNQREEVVHAQRVVLAVPADVAAGLLGTVDPAAAQALKPIAYPPVAVVHLGYRRSDVEHPLDGFGMLCPSRERRQVLGTFWPSTLFAGRAPEGAVLMTSFVGGAQHPELALADEEEIIESVIHEQRALVGAHGEPFFARVNRWHRAIPQYGADHTQRMAAIERLEAVFPNLRVLGNFRDGVSVERCWHKGYELGKHLPLPRGAGQAQALAFEI